MRSIFSRPQLKTAKSTRLPIRKGFSASELRPEESHDRYQKFLRIFFQYATPRPYLISFSSFSTLL